MVAAVKESGDGVVILVADLSANERRGDRRNERDGKQRGERHRERLGPGQRREEPALGAFQREDGKEADGDHEKREEDRPSDFLPREQNAFGARLLRALSLPPLDPLV